MNFETDGAAAAVPEQTAVQTDEPVVEAALAAEPADTAEDADAEPAVDAEFEQELRAVYAQSDPEQSAAELRAEFGPHYDAYLHLASGFARIDGFDEARRVLEVAGVVDHPAILRFLMNAGRVHYTAGTETDATAAAPPLPQPDAAFEDALEALRARQQEARDKGNSRKADALYRQEMELIARRNGGGIVDGRRTT